MDTDANPAQHPAHTSDGSELRRLVQLDAITTARHDAIYGTRTGNTSEMILDALLATLEPGVRAMVASGAERQFRSRGGPDHGWWYRPWSSPPERNAAA